MRTARNKKVKVKPRFFLILCLIAFVAIGFAMIPKIFKEDAAKDVASSFASQKETELSFMCVGDIMSHMPQTRAAYNGSTGEYNYEDSFKDIKKYAEKADLSLCNMEVTFPGKPYEGYPAFRVPDGLAESVAKSGFDVALTSNNHMADSGAKGVKRTAKVLRDAGMKSTGGKEKIEEKNYLIKEVKGVKVGIVSYTYADSVDDNGVYINGNPLYGEDKKLANYFTKNTIDQDLDKINNTVKAAEKDGAQLVIVYYHWGTEYETAPNKLQQKIAKATAKMNVDIIYASHPHVLQKADVIKVKDDKGKIVKEVPIYYSMGNFISNQNRRTMKNKLTEIGVLARINCTYNDKKDKLTKFEIKPIPTWVNIYYGGGKTRYRVVPLDENLSNNQSIKDSGGLAKAKQARKDGNDILGINQK